MIVVNDRLRDMTVRSRARTQLAYFLDEIEASDREMVVGLTLGWFG
jgi:hypothetical protein